MPSMSSCIFCKILAKQAPARVAYEDERCIAFHDIHPQAPVHLLIIPRKHFSTVAEAEAGDETLLGHLHRVAGQLAQEHRITDGYRVVVNVGPGAGQSVFHLHLHVLGGRPLRWPPG